MFCLTENTAVFVTNTSRLMVFREIGAVYCKNYTACMNILWRNESLINVLINARNIKLSLTFERLNIYKCNCGTVAL
jgi:hypothetical protein